MIRFCRVGSFCVPMSVSSCTLILMWVAPSRFAAVFRRGSSNARRSTSTTDVPRRQPGFVPRRLPLRRLQAVRTITGRDARLSPAGIGIRYQWEGRGNSHLRRLGS